MRKIMWGISFFMLAGTAVALQFMPESVPMHYNMAGEIDRWGSKYECLIFPALVLLTSLLWDSLSRYYEKKALRLTDEKESAGARSNAKAIAIVGVANAVMQTIMQGFLMYASYEIATLNTSQQTFHPEKIALILMGCLFIIIGNYMTKTRMNRIIGFRIKWSMYNDTTWSKSNRFGAIALIIAGSLSIFTSILLNVSVAYRALFVIMSVAILANLIYSYKVYREEINKDY